MRRRVRYVLSAALLGVVLLLTLIEFDRERQRTSFGADAAAPGAVASTPLRLGVGLASRRVRDAIGVVGEEVVAATPTPSGVRLSSVALLPGGRAATSRSISLDARPEAVAISADGRSLAAVARRGGGRPRVDVLALARDGSDMVQRYPAPAVISGGAVEEARLALVRWSGKDDDLVRLEQRADGIGVRVWSGESGFRRSIFEGLCGSSRGSLRLEQWATAFIQRDDGPPDLVLVSVGLRTPDARSEVHVLSGKSRLKNFSVDAATDLPMAAARQLQVAGSRSGDRSTIYVVDRQRGTVRAIQVKVD